MPVEHSFEGRVLILGLPADLDVAGRGAAVQQAQRLLLAHRPLGVRLHLPAGPASDAALSVLARLRRLCDGLSIPLTVTGPPWPTPISAPSVSRGASA